MAPRIFTLLYLLAMVVAGWRLFRIGWPRGAKVATGLALLLPVPLMLLLPALRHPDRAFADMLRGLGLALLLCGALCMAGGVAAAWFKGRMG
jgi:hypothetical protein